ncbi:spore germination protein [Paenibacillus sp. BR2-3]
MQPVVPKNASRSISGAGGGTGNVVNTVNGVTVNNVLDPDNVDNTAQGNV